MTHTPGPWRVEPEPDLHNDLVIIGSDEDYVAYIPEVTTEGESANARLIAAAVNSYDKHCGEHAIECAENDLLGNLLEALKEIAKCEGAYSRDELTHARNTIKNMAGIAEQAIAQVEK